MTFALRRDPQEPRPHELQQLVDVGNELVDAIVLGTRIQNNGQTTNNATTTQTNEQAQPGQLAFTGADLTAFVILAGLMLLIGMFLIRRLSFAGTTATV
jgi:hypothetical protein